MVEFYWPWISGRKIKAGNEGHFLTNMISKKCRIEANDKVCKVLRRIHKKYWGQGLATEGALKCLVYAKNDLQLNRIYSMASKTNLKSIKVMEKIGMTHIKDFEHPKLQENPTLKECVLFAIDL